MPYTRDDIWASLSQVRDQVWPIIGQFKQGQLDHDAAAHRIAALLYAAVVQHADQSTIRLANLPPAQAMGLTRFVDWPKVLTTLPLPRPTPRDLEVPAVLEYAVDLVVRGQV
jgi:hypothetical protein